MEFTFMFLKLIAALAIVLGAMIITLKYTNKGINNNIDKKYIRVIDRVQIAKDNYIVVVRVGKKGMVLSTAAGHTEKLEELSEEEVEKIEKDKRESVENMTRIFDKFIEKIKLKEEKHE
ncbi:flagellar biosynthetic protein FliO [Clostridium paraputrificum]|uniref:flagellar biosynthetic protein FliO n=1 Tax=Clostridium TaxID=1485 RepID=UPI003D33E5B4